MGRIMKAKQILRNCIDTKQQKMVSLERLAKELGVETLSDEEIAKIVNDKKGK